MEIVITRIVLICVFAVAGPSLLAGCGQDTKSDRSTQSVVAAFYPLAFAAEQIAGDAVAVGNLTPAGAEPHDLELTAGAARAVSEADIVLYLGSDFMPALARAVDNRDGTSLDLLEGLATLSGRDDEGHVGPDPHVWLDPILYAKMVQRIGALLDRVREADAFLTRLEVLDADLASGLKTCARREIITSHAAFSYLARRYGLTQVALEGLSPESEPSARALEDLVRRVRRTGATTIFFETLISPKLAQTVARETGAKTAVLNPIEGLTAEEIEAGKNYFSVMRENLAALRTALGCR